MNIIYFSNNLEKKDIDFINEFIHDCEIDKDEIFYDKDNLRLIIPFKKYLDKKAKLIKRFLIFKKYAIPLHKCYLEIKNINNFDLELGLYGPGSDDYLNEIIYDPKSKNISISFVICGNVSIKIEEINLLIKEGEELKVRYKISL